MQPMNVFAPVEGVKPTLWEGEWLPLFDREKLELHLDLQDNNTLLK